MRGKGFNSRMHLIEHDSWTAFNAVDEIKETHPTVKRFVTLSPITDMAKRFHERNGAKLIDINEWAGCQNFEYFV